MAKRVIKFIDLFCGAGGLSQGFVQASDDHLEFKSVFAVESDSPSAFSYEANFKHRVFSNEIESLRQRHLPSSRVELVLGGPPCQGFSPLGQMSPSAEHVSMNKLWKYFFRVVRWVQPRVFLVENVPEFLKSYEFLEAKKSAEWLGYSVAAGVLRAVDFEVPQQRKRGFMLGVLKGIPALPQATGAPMKTVKNAIWELKDEPLIYELPLNGSIRGVPKFQTSDLHIGRKPTPMSLERYRAIPYGGNRFDLLRARPDLTPGCWHRKKTGSTDVMGRLKWEEPALTIRTEFFKPEKGRYLHPELDRPITHWEAARLQTFPDTYQFCGSKIDIARQIGNAVPPSLAEAIAHQIKTYFT
jgi:DNA (cytosine-5)-methyltransferase 1